MEEKEVNALLKKAAAVLRANDRGTWTVPAPNLYPHQWLWDSCFIAIGLRHLNVERAQVELTSLLRGQWSNGMLPNMIFSNVGRWHYDNRMWRSWSSPYAPKDVKTSGITQPPMLAEAVYRVGQKLKPAERQKFFRGMLQPLVRYHEWLYAERDPHKEGLVILVHPYECGLDNTPPWISEMRKHNMPWWILLAERLGVHKLINSARRDTRHVPPGQRMSNIEAISYIAALHRLRRKAYNSEAILSRSLFAVQDLAFNCVLIRANARLREIAHAIERPLPAGLLDSMTKTEKALEELWDDATGQYFSRSFVSHKLIEEPTIATLLPLYAGAVSKQRAEELVALLNDKRVFGAEWPVPSVPLDSAYFNPVKYWQGPSWVNTNWLIIDGLRGYGYNKEANKLRAKTLDLAAKNGMNEYFNSLTGQPAGASNFSWTAALTIDLLESK